MLIEECRYRGLEKPSNAQYQQIIVNARNYLDMNVTIRGVVIDFRKA